MAQIRSRIYGNAVTEVVSPAKAGVQKIPRILDSGLRRNDGPNTSRQLGIGALSRCRATRELCVRIRTAARNVHVNSLVCEHF